jgi:hypothetical protein
MEFRLIYRGQLKSGNSVDKEHKHDIRKFFHPQLKELWDYSPLDGFKESLSPEPETQGDVSVVEQRKGFLFAPIVTDKLHTICELQITLLRPEAPGRIITSGDIDNRLKTLFDALRVPFENEIPINEQPKPEETPFFCLLQDDKLITKVSVECDRLLNPINKSDVLLIIYVKVKTLRLIWGNMGLGS